jgi:biopolymer transport protein ExbD
MSRKKRVSNEGDIPEPVVDISSLIDVSFLLLIYFLVTSVIAKEELDLRMALPSSTESTSDAPKVEPMAIRLAEDGSIHLKSSGQVEPAGGPKDVPNLFEELRRWKSLTDATGTAPFVIVSAEDPSQYQRFVDVMNVLSKCEIRNVTLTGFKDE